MRISAFRDLWDDTGGGGGVWSLSGIKYSIHVNIVVRMDGVTFWEIKESVPQG